MVAHWPGTAPRNRFMRHTQAFTTFLTAVVNLNEARITRLEGHVAAIEDFLSRSDYGASIHSFSPQGSWAHKTIIRPVTSEDRFDADLVMFVEPRADWTPKQHVEDLYRVFRASGLYKDKVSRNTRCVMLEYAKDFDLDVVPVVRREPTDWEKLLGKETTFAVCNRLTDEEEATDPEAYTAWVGELDDATSGMLRQSTRLLKYLRDIKGTFSVKSILLTTLVCQRAEERLAIDSWNDPWADLPTAFRTILSDLDDWLQARPIMPVVENPKVPGETFTRHWDQEKYENFRNCIHRYREWVDDAYNEADEQKSLKKWRDVFGDEFAPGAVTESATVAKSAGFADDRSLVLAAAQHGIDFLKRFMSRATHVVPVPWRDAPRRIPVTVTATLHHEEGGAEAGRLLNGQVIGRGWHIRFSAAVGMGGVPKGWRVRWRVTNTGAEAAAKKQLRGDLAKWNKGSTTHWEHTAYVGVHWVEAFVVDTKGWCIGRSEPFFVVIEDRQASAA